MINRPITWLNDIRFWIILFFLVRLTGIMNPPIETAHNWRQTTVTMVARNYYEVDNNILYPRIDIAGEKTGITGMEFPLLNYLIYLVSEIFGYEHWYGRIINLTVSSFGIYFFFLLVRKFSSHRSALYSSVILLFSIWFSYSRKIMPDTFSMSMVLAGAFYGTRYFDGLTKQIRIRGLILMIVFLTLGILSKLPSGYLLILSLLYFVDKKVRYKRKIVLMTSLIAVMIPVSFWYFFWTPYLVETYGFWHFFMGEGIWEGFMNVIYNFQSVAEHFYDHALKFSGFVLFVFGIVNAMIKKQRVLLTILFLCSLSFAVVVIKAGETFAEHAYYVVPFVPVMAFVAGYGLDNFRSRKWSVVFLVIAGLEGILNQQHDFFLKEDERAIVELDQVLNDHSKLENLILINSGFYPTPMYFAHRKGWVMPNEKINEHTIDSLNQLGLKNVLIMKKKFGEGMTLHLNTLYEDEHFRLYSSNNEKNK